MSEQEVEDFVILLRKTFQRIYDSKVVTYALIDGYCLGGGLELALACDFRLSTLQSQFALPETSLAIIPGAGGTQRLPRLVGVQNAKHLMYYAERINAEQALNITLIDQLFESREEMETSLLQSMEKLSKNGPVAIRTVKEAIQNGMDLPLGQGLELEKKLYRNTLVTTDRIEALKAFQEKRSPAYKGE